MGGRFLPLVINRNGDGTRQGISHETINRARSRRWVKHARFLDKKIVFLLQDRSLSDTMNLYPAPLLFAWLSWKPALTLYGLRATINKTSSATCLTGSGPPLQTASTFMAWKPSGFSRLFLCLILLVLTGCREQDQIRHYLAPKESQPELPARRMLAVMVPHGKDVWFFKFDGRKKEVSQHEADFDAVIRSVHFQDREDAPITWSNPPGWRRRMGPKPRYATLYVLPKSKRLEITVTRLGPDAADVRKNLDRWRGQLGLDPLTDAEFDKLANNSEVDGIKATRVDFIGVLQEEAAPMMGRPPQQQLKAGEAPMKYTTPDGWEAQPPIEKQGIRTPVVFRVRAGGSEAEATAMPLPGDGGGVSFNVNRWRRQVGLAPLDDAGIRRDLRSLKTAEREAEYVDLSGADKRILGAILPHGRQTWFFTLKGSPDLVGKEKSHFEAFIASIRFDAEAGAAHE